MPTPTTHHTGVTVSDLETSIDFYTDLLGCTVERRFSVEGPAFERVVDADGVSGTFAHLGSGDARIELVEYEPAADRRTEGSLPQPGATHLAFAVDDIDRAYGRLPGDVETLSEPETTESGTRLVFLRDPDGTLVELLEA